MVLPVVAWCVVCVCCATLPWAQVDPDSLCPDVRFIEQMGSLLDDDEHCDVTFFVGPSKTEVRTERSFGLLAHVE